MNMNDANELNDKIKANSVYRAFKLVFEILSAPILALLNKLSK